MSASIQQDRCPDAADDFDRFMALLGLFEQEWEALHRPGPRRTLADAERDGNVRRQLTDHKRRIIRAHDRIFDGVSGAWMHELVSAIREACAFLRDVLSIESGTRDRVSDIEAPRPPALDAVTALSQVDERRVERLRSSVERAFLKPFARKRKTPTAAELEALRRAVDGEVSARVLERVESGVADFKDGLMFDPPQVWLTSTRDYARPRWKSRAGIARVVPNGFRSVRGGWIVPCSFEGADAVSGYVTMLYEASRYCPPDKAFDANRRAHNRDAAINALSFDLRQRAASAERRAWIEALNFALQIQLRMPPDQRWTIAETIAWVSALLNGARLPQPPTSLTPTTLARAVGQNYERITLAERGGGAARVRSIRSALVELVASMKVELRGQEDVDRVLAVVRQSPGIHGERAIQKAAGIGISKVRVALATLRRTGEVENRGSEKRPRLFARLGNCPD